MQRPETWTLEAWKPVICSDKSSVTVFLTYGSLYVWKSPDEANNVDINVVLNLYLSISQCISTVLCPPYQKKKGSVDGVLGI